MIVTLEPVVVLTPPGHLSVGPVLLVYRSHERRPDRKRVHEILL